MGKCIKPLIRAETYEKYINKKGGISYKTEFLNRSFYDDKKEIDALMKTGKYRRITPVGCGQCIECALNRSRENATKMMMQKYCDKPNQSWFITCTYDDTKLVFKETVNIDTGETATGASLHIPHHQKFVKKLRKKHPNIKYVVAGEYGTQTNRPHYHFIMFGLDLDISQLRKVGINDYGQSYWEHPELTEAWGKGHVTIGEVTWESCAYVARYVIKKWEHIGTEWYKCQGIEPEYIFWSNGIGKQYYEEHLDTIWEQDCVPFGKNSTLIKPPSSFTRLLKETDPKLYEKVKRKRNETAEGFQVYAETDMPIERQREEHGKQMKEKFINMRKGDFNGLS